MVSVQVPLKEDEIALKWQQRIIALEAEKDALQAQASAIVSSVSRATGAPVTAGTARSVLTAYTHRLRAERVEMLTLITRLSTVLDKHRHSAERFLRMFGHMDDEEKQRRGPDARDCRDLLQVWDEALHLRARLSERQ
jgi:hypothetical protein